MEKLYKKIGWKNRPNLATPLGATNLNKIDEALDGLDNRTIELDEQRANHKRLIDDLYVNVNEHTSAIEGLTEKSNDIDALKIISTASGSPAYIDDASNMNIENIVFYGESKQNGTPTPTSPIPIESKIVNRVDVLGKNLLNPSGFATKTSNGVTFTPVFEDGLLQYINVNGTATADSYYAIIDKTNVPKETLVLNGCEGGSASTYSLLITYRNEDDTYADQAFQSQTDADLPIDASKKKYSVTIFVKSGATVNNARIYPMLRPTFFTDGTYEPYQSQTVNLSAPIELNGFGDVRDTDKIKKLGVVVFDGSSDENWMGSSFLAGRYGYTLKAKVNGKCMCTMAKNATNNNFGYCHLNQNGAFYINTSFATVEEWKAHLKANPMTVVYELAEPIETALPIVDQTAIKNLHTYKPNTVVTNDADAEMDVEYVADAKTYIDKKFEALASAIVNQ